MVTEDLLSTEVKEKAKELGQKYFPDSENIWARSNIEAKRVELACLEMAKWQIELPQLQKLNDTAFENGYMQSREDMLKNVIECTVYEDAGGYPYINQIELYDYDKDRPIAKKGDKIKVLIFR